MANGFNTDYSFLNLPEAGSSAQGPIEAPSFDPTDFSFDSVDRFAPKNLPSVDTFAPSLPSLSADENEDVLNNARAFEDVRTLGATFGQKLAGVEKFFGEQVNNLKDNINSLENSKSEINIELENAIQLQDQIRAEAAQEQLEALEQQKQELQMQLQQAVSEAESQGIDAVAAAEATAAENLSNVTADFQNEINNITGARDSAVAERDQAIAQQDTIRAESANAQAQALDAQAGDYQAQLDELTGQSTQYQGQVSERDQTIADLQAQIAELQNVPQPPADTPPPPTPPPPPFIPPNREPEPINITDIPLTAPIAMPRNPDMVKMIQDKMGQDQLFIDDGPMNKDDFIASMPNEKPVPFIPKPPRDDFISYERINKPNPRIDGIGGFLGKSLGRMGRR